MSEPDKKNEVSNPAEPSKVPQIDSDKLFQGQKMLVIHHAGEDYRLILTRNNRLILQK